MTGVREVGVAGDDLLHRTEAGGGLTICGRFPDRFLNLPDDPCPWCFDVIEGPFADHPLADVWALCARLDQAARAAVQPRNRENQL